MTVTREQIQAALDGLGEMKKYAKSNGDNRFNDLDLIDELEETIRAALTRPVGDGFTWVNPHDKNQKQWLPWIKEKVLVKFKDGSIHEGWHTGGSWMVYAKPAKHFENDDVVAWCYKSALPAAPKKWGA